MKLRTSLTILFGALCLAFTLACHSGDNNPPPPPVPVAISVAPTTSSLVVGGNQSFTATVTGSTNTAATWTVQEGAPGGTVSSGGVYTAPATPGTYHVIATSAADTTKTASATVTVAAAPVVAVTLTPTTASLLTGANQTFVANVTGNANTAVTWTVQEGAPGGTVSSGGVYTAPATPGTYHVIATSAADTTKTASATVTVSALVVVTLSNTSATVSIGSSKSFTATVTGNANTAVTWTVQEGAPGGTITSGGVYTAPATPGTYHVIATSVADNTKSASATVTVILAATGLDYVDPTTGTYRLMKNTTLSTPSHLVLDLVGVGAPSGAAIAFTLSTDPAQTLWVKVDVADLEFIQNGTVLTLGTAPLALKGKVAAGVLTAGLGQKGTGSSVALNGVLARVALELQVGAPVGTGTLSAPKAQMLLSDGSLPTVSISIGTLTMN